MTNDTRTVFQAIVGDGRFLLIFTGLILLLSGLFVIVQFLTGHFLPHDVSFIGLDAIQLSQFQEGRITQFMFHDRVSFGGSIMAVGVLYMWLAEFPLKNREPWAWLIFLFSGCVGFGSFLTYLGYGYLDTWHGIATLLLLPFFILGLTKSYALVKANFTLTGLFKQSYSFNIRSRYGLGLSLMLFSAIGLISAGGVIMVVGMTEVFVPQDLAYMNITVCGIDQINANLKPLIAHDRAAFGGGLSTIGLIYFFMLKKATPTISLWQIMAISLLLGFSTAIGVHFVIGYIDFIHLLPAYFGVLISLSGLMLTYSGMKNGIECTEAKLNKLAGMSS